MSRSSYTYRDHAIEYQNTYEYTLWHGEQLSPIWSMRLFGEPNASISLSSDEVHEELERPRVFSTQQSDTFIAEGMIVVPDRCKETVSKIISMLDLDIDTMPVVMGSPGTKDIVFTMNDCVLCKSGSSTDVYIPMSFLKKVQVDLKDRSIETHLSGTMRKMPYYKTTTAPSFVLSTFDQVAMQTRNITRDHRPMYDDGHKKYTMVNATLCILLQPQRSITETGYGGDSIINHGKRSIHVLVFAINSLGIGNRNDVAGYTSDGSNTPI